MTRLTTHKELSCDVLVAGGGLAGVCCALAAARTGSSVILCQDRSVLGGNASSEVRMHVVGATGLRGGKQFESELREGGIIEEIRLDLAVNNPQRAASMMDLVLYDKCRREPNLSVMFNTSVDGAELDGKTIRAASATRPSTEESFRITATVFVDCTGDGRLAAEAGVPFRHGREGTEEFGERLAQPQSDPHTLGSTIMFQARKHNRPMPFDAPPWVRKFSAADLRLRPFGIPGSDLGLEYGYWWAEWGGLLNTIKDNEQIRDELLAITLGVWNHIKNESEQDAENWALEWIGFLPGKRESRRFLGRHVLTEQDVLESRAFPDAIAYGGWPIDTHPPEGVDAIDQPPCVQHHLEYLFDIPLRSCIASTLDNLLFAGRILSATHIAFASTRVMGTCAVVGQGVGTAAAIAVREEIRPGDLSEHPDVLQQIQQQLILDDCYLIGVRNEDPNDLVRSATRIVASSTCDYAVSDDGVSGDGISDDAMADNADAVNAVPDQVRSGQSRSVHGATASKLGQANRQIPTEKSDNSTNPAITQSARVTCAPPDRATAGIHRWMSSDKIGLPAWLAIEWSESVPIREIQLVFDTGLHRHLTLSQADGYTASMQWGQAQEETVRDYQIDIKTVDGWAEVIKVENNYQRLRRHRLVESDAPALVATALRITVTATNGVNHARICEVRAY